MPLHLLGRYMDSMRVDCEEPVRIASRAQLDDYMEGSAATVGRVISPLLGAPEPEAVARLGVAFQLTNFIRDVPIDWDLDRVYLPGLPEDDLRAAPPASRCANASPRRSRAPAACSRRPPGASRWRPGCATACAWRARSTPACSIASRATGTTCSGRGRACARGRPRGRPGPMAGTSADVLVCGASFAGLAVARELAGAGADVLVSIATDRRARHLGLRGADALAARHGRCECHPPRAAGDDLHDAPRDVRYRLPWSWSAFDYRELCAALWAQCGDARFELRRSTGEQA